MRRRAALAAAIGVIAVLGVAGIGIEGKLQPTSLAVPGTESARGEALLERHFGDSEPFAILLRGPAGALDRQGPALVRALRSGSRASTLSPWDRGSIDRLRPAADRALILVDFDSSSEEALHDTVPELESTLQRTIGPPVTATQTGFATLSRALQEESVNATERAELIALPILLVVLLLVFGSPVAAAIPLLFGALTVATSRGLLALAAPHVSIDGFALTVCTMMGLALGVDYALLAVSRFREELARGASPAHAASTTRRTASRTIAAAGSTLIVAMLVTLALMPGALLVSLAGAAIVVTVVSVAIASLLTPPLLRVLGDNVNRWQLGGERDGRRLLAAVSAALGRPRRAAAVVMAGLLILAVPALATKTGPPSAAQLPASNESRRDAESLDRQIGPGWDAPFTLVAVTEHGTIADPPRLAALARAQRRIAADPGVATAIGPAQVRDDVTPLRRNGRRLLAGRGEASPARLRRLGRGLERAASGVGGLRGGLAAAGDGAGLLASGSGRAGEGASQIAAGLQRASAGAGRASGALGRLDAAAGALAGAQHRAALGALSLRFELDELTSLLRGGGVARARKLRGHLNRAAASDPALAPFAHEAERLTEALTLARNEAQWLGRVADRLHDGQARIAGGGERLHRGTERLADAAAPLATGLERLGEGSEQLAGGLARLEGGAGALQRNLAAGSTAAAPLESRLRGTGARVRASASRLRRQVSGLRRSSPGIFDSGHFVLSALDGAPATERQRAGRVVDLRRGGQAAQIVVVPRSDLGTPASAALYEHLKGDAAALEAGSGLETAIAGGPAQLADYDAAISRRMPLLIAAVALVTFLVLVVVLRALPLAALAVALNLLVVAVAFGVLALLAELPAGWPLGGRTYIDAIGAAGIFGIVFGLSIDYAVFLLTRMREARQAGVAHEEAVAFGLRRTARVITGAAAIMVAVFACFAGASIATVSQLGVGLTVAVLLDATVVRIVLLPALMLLAGERIWWLPTALERRLPKIDLHPA